LMLPAGSGSAVAGELFLDGDACRAEDWAMAG